MSISTEKIDSKSQHKLYTSISKTKVGKNIHGVILVFIIAFIANSVGQSIPLVGSTVTAILLGVLLRNFMVIPVSFDPGISYALKKLLKFAIILLGISIDLWYVLSVGFQSLIGVIMVVLAGIILTVLVGRWMKLSGDMPLLIGIGTSICGATAIATVSPIMKAKEEETAFAITTIFIFNIIAVVVYPIVGSLVGMSDEMFGVWAGLALHDTSSVVAAGYAYSDAAGDTATIVKLTRTLFLIPLAIILGVYVSMKKKQEKQQHGDKVKIVKIFPWFLLGFLGLSVVGTLGVFSENIINNVTSVSKFMILMAMASVGLGAKFEMMKKVGMKPVYCGLFASLLVAIISLVFIYMV